MLQDEFYIKHIAEKQVLGPVLDVLLVTMPRDNLLCSACLDLFELIKKENIKDLVKHLVENYREKLAALTYMDTFRDILDRYDQTQGFTNNVDAYFLESDDEVGRRPTNANTRGMMEHLAVDPAQEEYWNTSDDEDELGNPPGHGTAPNGASPAPKPLVDYASDEEGEENGDTAMAQAGPDGDRPKDDQDAPSRSSSVAAAAAAPPPERVSEKRRREQEEDDELDKLIHNKRRNSSSASLNSAGVAAVLRKKKSFAGGSRDPSPNGPKRISISLSPSLRSSAGHSPTPDGSAA